MPVNIKFTGIFYFALSEHFNIFPGNGSTS